MSAAKRSPAGDEATVQLVRPDDGTVPISTTVIEAIAAAEEVDPTEVNLDLHHRLDLDALDTLYDTATGAGERLAVNVTIGSYLLAILEDGTVTVSPTADD